MRYLKTSPTTSHTACAGLDATSVLEELGCDLFLEMPPGRALTDLAMINQPNVRFLAVSQYPMSKLAQFAKE